MSIILLLLILAVSVEQIVRSLAWGHESWQLTDWLINYSGGFVRRGLPGEIIFQVSQYSGIPVNHLAIFTSALIFLALAIYLARSTRGRFAKALMFSCLVIGFPAYQDSILRKDCLGLLLMAGCIKVFRSAARPSIKVVLCNLLASFAILSHETFVFYALPGLVLLAVSSSKTAPDYRKTLLWGPSVLSFVWVVLHHGTPEQASQINHSLIPLWESIEPGKGQLEVAAGSIGAIGWSSEEGLSPGLNLLTSGWYQPSVWAFLFGSSFLLLLLFTGTHLQGKLRALEQTKFASVLIAQLVFLSPLFVLGHDYGRWLFLWVVSSMILHTEGVETPRLWQSLIERLEDITAPLWSRLNRVPSIEWIFLIVGIPSAWNVHEFLHSNPLSRVLTAISSQF